jgi:hypothetical protein
VKDPRCEVSYGVLRERLAKGAPSETAMKREAFWLNPRKLWEAFGEQKTCDAWGRDPRCRCSRAQLRRLLASGVPIEEALSGARGPMRVVASGEEKAAAEWARDPRAGGFLHTIKLRLALGWSAEKAIAAPARASGPLPPGCTRGPYNRIFIEAFG